MWYLASEGKTSGPLSTEQVRAMVLAGRVLPTTHAWKEGMAAWAPLCEIRELAGLVPSAEPTSRPAAAPPRVDESVAGIMRCPSNSEHVYARYLPRCPYCHPPRVREAGSAPRPLPRAAAAEADESVQAPDWLPAGIVSLASRVPIMRDMIVRGAHDADVNPWAGAMFVAAILAFEPHVRTWAWVAGVAFFVAAMLRLQRVEGGMRLAGTAAVVFGISAMLSIAMAPSAPPSPQALAAWVGVVDSSFGFDHGLLPLVGWLPDGAPVLPEPGVHPESWRAWASPHGAIPAKAGSNDVVGIECGEKRRHRLALEEAGGDDPSASPFLAVTAAWKVGRFKASNIGAEHDEVVATVIADRRLVGPDGQTRLAWTWSTWKADGIEDGREVWFVTARGRDRDQGFGELYFAFVIRDPGRPLHLGWSRVRSAVYDRESGENRTPVGHFVGSGGLQVVLRVEVGNELRYDVINPDTREVVTVAGSNCR